MMMYGELLVQAEYPPELAVSDPEPILPFTNNSPPILRTQIQQFLYANLANMDVIAMYWHYLMPELKDVAMTERSNCTQWYMYHVACEKCQRKY